MREMVIDSIRVSLLNYSRIVILKEKDAERFLPIWIGQPEAEAIALKLQDMTPPRPVALGQADLVVVEVSGADATVQFEDCWVSWGRSGSRLSLV